MIERFGMIGKKVGMTRVYDDQGQATAVTVISAEPNTVYEVRTPEKNGVKACLLYTSPSPRDLSTSRMPSSA